MIKLDGRVVNLGHFPDGTLLIKENVSRDYEAERSATINWKYENDGELVALIYLTRHLKEHGVKTVHLNECQSVSPNFHSLGIEVFVSLS